MMSIIWQKINIVNSITLYRQRGNVVTDLEGYVKDKDITKFIIIDEPDRIRNLKEK